MTLAIVGDMFYIEHNGYDKVLIRSAAYDGELHAIATVCDVRLSYGNQLAAIAKAIGQFVMQSGAEGFKTVMLRVFLSDAANQAEEAVACMQEICPQSAIAYIEQPPLNGTKIAVWLYLQKNADVNRIDEKTVMVKRGDMCHLWSANVCNSMAETYAETKQQLDYLDNMLKGQGLNIADNCVRTWFFVQNIDVNYGAVVKARRENFNENGLTKDTHYISSTGIGGRHAEKEVTSVLDAYCVGGLAEGQMRYLYAADNMNRTIEYGVTFERGTYVDYADRRHIFISGTASIDNKGDVVAPGDIVAQTHRMIENVDALLAEAEAGENDLAHIIVYLRDVADYVVVNKLFAERFANVPYVITLAPVCRPGWLIEMECMAIAKRHSSYARFI